MTKKKGIEGMIIYAENIHKRFGSVYALKGVDIGVYPGEILGLVGDNGAGKSTLTNILAGVIPPTEGKIYNFGKEVTLNSIKDSRRIFNLEIVYQDQALVPHLSIVANIFLSREKKKKLGLISLLDDDYMEKEASGLLNSLGLKIGSVKRDVRFCSGGERQGVAIARALYHNARIVILDEPTTALSVKGVEKVKNYVKELKEKDVACVYITHQIREVHSLADRLVVMSRGKIIENIEKGKKSFEEVEEIIVKS